MGSISYFFAGLWPIVAHYSFWGLSMAALGALVWFRPGLWKPAAWAAAVITAGTVCYAFGVNDGKRHEAARCETEKRLAIEGAKRARAKAQRSLARKPQSGWLSQSAQPDPDCRDC